MSKRLLILGVRYLLSDYCTLLLELIKFCTYSTPETKSHQGRNQGSPTNRYIIEQYSTRDVPFPLSTELLVIKTFWNRVQRHKLKERVENKDKTRRKVYLILSSHFLFIKDYPCCWRSMSKRMNSLEQIYYREVTTVR